MTAASQPSLARLELALSRLHRLYPGALVCAFALRLVLVWQRPSPEAFPDEYQYTALARSLARLGNLSIRGHSAHFAALLTPILTAPAWLFGNVSTDFRISQGIGTAAMTLAAIPAYRLARRAGLSQGMAATVGALTLLVPDTVYAGFLLSEPFAYPLVLGAVWAAVEALAAPTRRNQLAFLLLAGLALFTRLQLVVVPLAFVAALAAIGLRERSLARTVRAQRLPLGVLASGALAVSALVLARGLGYYSQLGHTHVGGSALSAARDNLVTLLYASGWVLVPGALLGIALALIRPRSRAEFALAALTVSLLVAVVGEASVFGAFWGTTTVLQERYTFYVIPLLAACFCLYASRCFPHRLAYLLLAGGLLLTATEVPVSGLAQPNLTDDAPVFWAVERLALLVGGTITAATIVLISASLLALLAACAPLLGRFAAAALLGLAVLVSGVVAVGAWQYDRGGAADLVQALLPRDHSWVDDAHLGDSTLVMASSSPGDADFQLFWNRSITSVGLLPGAAAPDPMATEPLRVDRRGLLLSGGRPLRGPVVIDESGTTMTLQRARPIAEAPDAVLWRPAGAVRLRMLFAGRALDGPLAPTGSLTLWPGPGRLAGWLSFTVRPLPGQTLRFAIAGRAHPDGRVVLRVCARSRWQVSYTAGTGRGRGEQLGLQQVIAGAATTPVFHPDAALCPSPHPHG